MRILTRAESISRRALLAGLGAGAAAMSPTNPVRAALLPSGRRTEKHDVIVIGTGMAGTTAALQAKLDGADVMVLEKMPDRLTPPGSPRTVQDRYSASTTA